MKILFKILIITLIAGAVASCKTTEENYKKAYQAAVEKQNEAYTGDEVALMNAEEAIPRTLFHGDSIPLKGMYVNTFKLTDTTTVAQRYNVVVAKFKQKFNATSVYNRLIAGGYPNARILIDREQTYYVAAVTTPSLDTAVAAWKTLSKSSPVILRPPFPYILEKGSPTRH